MENLNLKAVLVFLLALVVVIFMVLRDLAEAANKKIREEEAEKGGEVGVVKRLGERKKN